MARKSTRPPSSSLEKGTIGREEDIDAQEAEVRGLEGRVVEANIQLSDTTLARPYDGVIAQRFVEEGQNVRAKAAGRPVSRRRRDRDRRRCAGDGDGGRHPARPTSSSWSPSSAARPGLQFPVADPRDRPGRRPDDADLQSPRRHARPPEGIRVLPGMTATVTVDLPPGQHPGQPHPGAGLGRVQATPTASKSSGSSAPTAPSSPRPVKLGDVDRRRDRDHRGPAAGRPHRRGRRARSCARA